jgi:hypothetical protein
MKKGLAALHVEKGKPAKERAGVSREEGENVVLQKPVRKQMQEWSLLC